ncbi:STM4015 family protein [Micromonospora sp. WMMD882]|uniref:STM4015 family protein n=1 Tax=Micromonospora sp. WMMD882 TaxID=3015151 RepID=UPI00248B3FC2|nr:STM4015 family protein [Micromonospora sp. WMMD882]WBB81087.1 STM4015 family protein [Micromonospora sp. WMMD882]
MTINSHVTTFDGLPVVRFAPDLALPADPSAVAWRVEAADYDSSPQELTETLEALLAAVPAGSIRALVVGQWGSPYENPAPVDLLVSLAPRLTGLRALFLGEMTFEECEISWIRHGDVSGLLTAYPALEVLRVRGADGLTLRPTRHPALRELAFESGGLPAAVVRAVGESDLPALTHLELWLGVDDYGRDATVADLAPVLGGDRLPALRTLGLCNTDLADEVAAAVATAGVVPRLTALDLSMGTLTDVGGEALLAGQPLTHLRRLDLRHHFLSEELAGRLVARLAGVDVDVDDARKAEEYDGRVYRYTMVGE